MFGEIGFMIVACVTMCG